MVNNHPNISTITWRCLVAAVLSVRFEVGVSLLLAPAGADKRGPKAPFLLVGLMQEYSRQFAREYPPEVRREPGLTESTVAIVKFLIAPSAVVVVKSPMT